MLMPGQSLQLWLPALAQFEAGHPLRAWLARANRMADGASGYRAGLAQWFTGIEADLPAAAITRQLLAGDAGDAIWLSADPAWAQPDMSGVRLMACGHMQLQLDEAQALADGLRPALDEVGMQLLVSEPDHWHLRLSPGTPFPVFTAPEQALGEDLGAHLPQGAEGRRWRILLNDLQVLLHQHPLNAQRQQRGQSPINCLWLWGGGCLPPPPVSQLAGVVSDDLLLRALAAHAGIARQRRTTDAIAASGAAWLVDLQDLPAHALVSSWLPALIPLFDREPVVLHFASGERWLHKPWHRWRFWRGAGR
jgi:hypothetical protein